MSYAAAIVGSRSLFSCLKLVPMARLIELSAPDGGLASCLSHAKVDKIVKKFIVDAKPAGLGLESLTDFVRLMSEASFEHYLDRRITQPLLTSNKLKAEDEPLATSRIRAAYVAGKRALATMDPAAQAFQPASTEEAPLPQGVQATLQAQWDVAYPG